LKNDKCVFKNLVVFQRKKIKIAMLFTNWRFYRYKQASYLNIKFLGHEKLLEDLQAMPEINH